ncbi:MAG: helical backbone metal receptor [Saprospiraceae bacterium]
MAEYMDQCQRIVGISAIPKRIISIVPSQTSLLDTLGLDQHIIGVTKFCVHPSEYLLTKEIIGGTKTLDIEKIRALKPDLIIANKEENVQEQIDALQEFCPVWVSDISNLTDALQMISQIAEITGTQAEALELTADIELVFSNYVKPEQKLRVLYLIWRKPYMSVGGDTFIHDMLDRAGFDNIFGHLERYPVIDLDLMRAEKPDIVFLSSEPFPFAQKHIEELEAICVDARILLVDGEMFSWYGSNLLKAPAYFEHLKQIIVSK